MLVDMTLPDGLPSERIVRDEQPWFAFSRDDELRSSTPELSVSRWTGFASEPREEVSEIKPDYHVLGVALRPMDLTIFTARKLIHDGRLQQGMMRVNEPGQPIRGIFRGAYDTLHLHIPNSMIHDFIEAGSGPSGKAPALSYNERPIVDPVIERLAHALVRADDLDSLYGRQYADGIGRALVARLLCRGGDGKAVPGRSSGSGLPKWRLKRAIDFVAAHLGEPIGLTDIAASTGLTRMHFAAQFKVSTGLRPHEYLVRRRIERAQELLATSRLSLIEVAFEVGFTTQAHFTTVFSRFVGTSPGVWRRANHTGSLVAAAARH